DGVGNGVAGLHRAPRRAEGDPAAEILVPLVGADVAGIETGGFLRVRTVVVAVGPLLIVGVEVDFQVVGRNAGLPVVGIGLVDGRDRKSTRLNSSHVKISYAVFCLKKKRGIK